MEDIPLRLGHQGQAGRAGHIHDGDFCFWEGMLRRFPYRSGECGWDDAVAGGHRSPQRAADLQGADFAGEDVHQRFRGAFSAVRQGQLLNGSIREYLPGGICRDVTDLRGGEGSLEGIRSDYNFHKKILSVCGNR